MSLSEVQICNMALAHIGIDQPIVSLTESSKPAKLCNLFFAQSRDAVLRDHPWNFATGFVSLALVAGDPPPGWDYAYAYPNDCVMARAVTDDLGIRVPLSIWLRNVDLETRTAPRTLVGVSRVPFAVMADAAGTGRIIATDLEQAFLLRTRRIESPSAWDPQFVEAMTWMIASKLVMPMLGPNASGGMLQYVSNMYRATIAQAGAQNLNEQGADQTPDSEIITSRG